MWEIPPQNLILHNNDIHIWLINMEDYQQKIDSCKDILSQDEQEKTNKFASKLLKKSFIISRAFLRIILSKYLKTIPQEIYFTYNNKGKPQLDTEALLSIKFNLSHKNNYVIYGFSYHNIGIDLEKIDDKIKVEKIAQRFFCNDEFNYLKTLDSKVKIEYFLKLWTKKEAYLKAIGKGLSGGLDSICFLVNNHHQKIDFIINKNNNSSDNWYFKTWILKDNYIMSIAINSIIKTKFYYYSNPAIIDY